MTERYLEDYQVFRNKITTSKQSISQRGTQCKKYFELNENENIV